MERVYATPTDTFDSHERSKARPDEDEQLVKLACQGDEGAITVLYTSLSPRLKTFLGRLTSNATDAEDVAHETLTKALTRLDLYEAKRGVHFGTWVYSIARNRSVDHVRKLKRRVSLSLESSEEEGHYIPSRDLGPEESVVADDRYKTIMTLIDSLPENQRLTIHARFVEGLTVEQSAHALGVSTSTISSNQRRGSLKLQKSIRQQRLAEAT